MKSIYVLLMLLFTGVNALAQYNLTDTLSSSPPAEEFQSSETNVSIYSPVQKVSPSYNLRSDEATYNLKQKRARDMYTAGQAVFYTGAAAATVGLLCIVADAIEGGGWGTLFGLTATAIGTGTAVIGLPFWLCGRKNISDMSTVRMQFGSGDQKGGTAILELGGGISPHIMGRVTGGYNFNQHIFLGGGVAYYRSDGFMLPIYADVRYSFGNNKIAPYIGLDAGYDFLSQGVYGAGNFGIRIRSNNPVSTSSWWITSYYGVVSGSAQLMGIKAGYSF